MFNSLFSRVPLRLSAAEKGRREKGRREKGRVKEGKACFSSLGKGEVKGLIFFSRARGRREGAKEKRREGKGKKGKGKGNKGKAKGKLIKLKLKNKYLQIRT